MKFKDLADLVNQVNATLGEFCDEFGSKRKELAGLGKVPKRGILFKLTDQSRDWAINEGGGTELQYHIAFEVNDLEIRYGLGFNTQYVPFANEKSSVDYMRPYMFGFLKNEKKIGGILPDYTFVYGDIQQLKAPQKNQYTLFGKSISVKNERNGFFIDDDDFQIIISDLKKQFEAYQIIFSDKNHFSEVAMNNQSIIDVLTHKGQIILQGPPGTGKTYTAKDIAEQMLFSEVSEDKTIQKDRLENTEQFKFVQFHPAFSYEDFVRGIVAESKGISIEYKTKNKLMVDFANRALRNYENSRKDKAQLKEENWIQENFLDFSDFVTDEIEKSNGKLLLKGTTTYLREVENDCFRYTGDNWSNIAGNRMRFEDIIKMYRANVKTRQEIKKMTGISGLAIQHASYYMRVLDMFYSFMDTKKKPDIDIPEIEEKKYVLIIDEINRANLPAVLGELIYALEYRGEKVESMYPVDDDNTLIIPPNLYIIGTMNTSDRSVGHIDYAIRRRFAFIDVLPKILDIENFELELFQQVSALFIQNFDAYALDTTVELIPSEHLSEEFRPEDVWLGHSYFIKGEGDFSIRKSYEIIPILKEYLKDGILKQSAETLIRAL
jgi:DNA polymerase III delta prime subunit